MSQRKETRTRTVTEEVVTATVCDLCGRVGEGAFDPFAGPNERARVTVEADFGEQYGGDGFGAVTTFDVCPECWRTRVVPWFRSQGAEPRVREYDL